MKITVYCGANSGINNQYELLAKQLGTWIYSNHHTLVYGGGKKGLMGVVADTVLDNGGFVIGVIPEFLVDLELAHPGLQQMHVVENMHQRKQKMIALGDAFIALPGGPGTLEEITEVISLRRLNQHQKPCLLINTTGFYNNLKQQMELMVQEGFLTTSDFQQVLFIDQLSQLDNILKK